MLIGVGVGAGVTLADSTGVGVEAPVVCGVFPSWFGMGYGVGWAGVGVLDEQLVIKISDTRSNNPT